MAGKPAETTNQTVNDPMAYDEDNEFVAAMMEKARHDLLYVASRVIEITTRYFQWRVREMMSRGFPFHHSYNMKIEGNRIIAVLELEVPEELVERFARHYGFLARMVRQISRNYRRADRYATRAGIFEDLEGERDELEPEIEIVPPTGPAGGGGAKGEGASEAAGAAEEAREGEGAEPRGRRSDSPGKGD